MQFHSFKSNPSLQDLEDIDLWMRCESKTGNLNSISEAWGRNELVLINLNHNILGICAFKINDFQGTINILEIRENYRGQKLGVYLVEYILQLMESKGVERLEIFVPDLKIKPFWEKLGFKEIIKSFDDSRLDMYFNFNKK